MAGQVTVGALLITVAAQAQTFQLPTANQALFEKEGEERYFVGTAGKPWMTGRSAVSGAVAGRCTRGWISVASSATIPASLRPCPG